MASSRNRYCFDVSFSRIMRFKKKKSIDFHGVSPVPDEIALVGKVVQRADCKPAFTEDYLRLKKWVCTLVRDLNCSLANTTWLISSCSFLAGALQQFTSQKIPQAGQAVAADRKSRHQLQTCGQPFLPCKNPLLR